MGPGGAGAALLRPHLAVRRKKVIGERPKEGSGEREKKKGRHEEGRLRALDLVGGGAALISALCGTGMARSWAGGPAVLGPGGGGLSPGLPELREHRDAALSRRVWVVPGVGPGDPCGSLPARDVLWFLEVPCCWCPLLPALCCVAARWAPSPCCSAGGSSRS